MATESIKDKTALPLVQLFGIWLVSGMAVVAFALIYTNIAGIPAESAGYNEIVRLIQGSVFAMSALFGLSLLGTDLRAIFSGHSVCGRRSFGLTAKYFLIYLLAVAALIGALFLAVQLLIKFGFFSMESLSDSHASSAAEKLAQKNYLREVLLGSPARFFVYIFSTCVLIPIGEEIFTRRFLYVSLRRKLGVAASLIISSLFFGLSHLGAAALPAAVYSVYLGWIYEKHQDLSVNIMVHGLINFTVLLTMLYFSL